MASRARRRLHFLNALFAPLTGNDVYLAGQLDSAILHSLGRDDDPDPADPAFVGAAARLFSTLCADPDRHGFFHWDAAESGLDASPLFVRAKVMQGLKRLAAFPQSTVLVTNLQPAHRGPRKRWSARRRREYDETISLIRRLAAARTRRGALLHLVVV